MTAPFSKDIPTKRRKYVHKYTGPEATARRRISSQRNWDVLQLTNIIGQLKKLEANMYNGELYKHKDGRRAEQSTTRSELSLAYAFANSALKKLKAHNKDPQSKPLL